MFDTSSRKRKGFTLIELLVVIAIIAILAAILFPVFAQAREKARAIACDSNMKQVSLAVLQYTQDNDEAFPPAVQYAPAGDPAGGFIEWSSSLVIGPYLKSTATLQCPDDAFKPNFGAGILALPGNRRAVPDSYMVNAITPYSDWGQDYTQVAYDGVSQPAGVFAPEAGYPWRNFPNVTQAQLHYPSDLVMFVDAKEGWSEYGGQQGEQNNENDTWWDAGRGCWQNWGYFSMSQVYYGLSDAILNPTYPDGKGMTKHSGGTNVAFSDGHVKWWIPTQFLTNNGQPDPKNWLSNAL